MKLEKTIYINQYSLLKYLNSQIRRLESELSDTFKNCKESDILERNIGLINDIINDVKNNL